MKSSATAVVLLLLGFFLAWAADSGQTPIISVMAAARSYVLTKGPTGKVRVRTLERSFKPGVSIFSDGRVVITKFNATEHKTTLSQKQVESLRGAFNAPDFLSITPEVLEKRMKAFDAATHTGFGVEDGGFWTISVFRGTSNHTLTVSAPFLFARHYTNVQELRILTNLLTLPWVSAGIQKFE